MSADAQPRVFISYRRTDSEHATGRLVHRLESHLGDDHVYWDRGDIPPGVDYRNHISGALDRVAAAIVVIGPGWTAPIDGGGHRIDDSADPVRVEVEQALSREIPVIPLLVDARVDLADLRLPDSLTALRFRNALPLRADPDFDADCDRLIEALEAIGVGGDLAADVDEMRRRLLTADRGELERLAFEIRAVRAARPDDPDVLQLHAQIERALAPSPPMEMVPPPLPTAVGGRRRRGLVSAIAVAGAAAAAAAFLAFGAIGGVSSPPGNHCDSLDATVEEIGELDPVRLLLPGGGLRIVLRVSNVGDRAVTLPALTELSLITSDGAQQELFVVPSLVGTWFAPFDLAAGANADSALVTDAGWQDAGLDLERLEIRGVRIASTFDSCDLTAILS